jgi:hypothetical protein
MNGYTEFAQSYIVQPRVMRGLFFATAGAVVRVAIEE